MITKKTKKLITIIIPIILIIIIVAITIGILYIKTDFLKSNDVLFAKYAMQNIEVLQNIFKTNAEDEYTNLLKQNNYEYNAKIEAEYLNNSEKVDDLINDITIDIDGKVNNTDNINYSNITLNNKDEKLIDLEYINKNNNMYSLKFSDIFKQYISIENNNLKELAEKLGIASDSIPDKISQDNKIIDQITFTNEDINNLKNNYKDLIIGKIPKDKYSKQKNAVITVNDKSITTNAYTLKLTKEEANNIYISILQNLKEDTIILNKIDQIENLVKQNSNNQQEDSNVEFNIKEDFINNIDDEIEKIQSTNIGNDEIKYTVYENKRNIVRTLIESDAQQIIIDITNNEETEDINIQRVILKQETNKQTINLSKKDTNNNYNFIVKYSNTDENTDNEIEYAREILTNNNTVSGNVKISYLNGTNQISFNFEKNNNILQQIPEIEEISEDNNVILNNYSKEELSTILNTISVQVQNKLNEKFSTLQPRFNSSILNLSNLYSNNFTIEDTNQMSEVEKNRFNAKFEFYEAEETTYENVTKLLEVVAENLGSIEVLNNTQLKLNIEKGKENKETVNNILNILKDRDKYEIQIKYDENNVIDNIILTILK